MDRKQKKMILGIIIASLVSLITIPILLASECVIVNLFEVELPDKHSLETLIGILITIGIPGFCLIVTLIGLSTNYFFSKFNLKKWYYYLISGMIWGAIIIGLCLLTLLKGLPFHTTIYLFFTNELICVIGFLCYWWIAVRE